MGLETGTYISSLNSANPTTSDAKTEGDDHIRLLKATILATFPNITGAVTPTHTELNYVDGVTSAIQTQLDAKLANTNWSFSTNRLVNGGNTQPSFRARATGDITNGASGSTLVFGTEDYDQGGVYNNSTGTFTAPIAGVYLFTAHAVFFNTTALTIAGHGIFLKHNSTKVSQSNIGEHANNDNASANLSTVVRMAVNDTMVLCTFTGLGANEYIQGSVDGYTSFSGVLLF